MRTTVVVLAACAAFAAAQEPSPSPVHVPCYKDFGTVAYSLAGEENTALTLEDGTVAGVESDWYYNVGICSNVIPDAQYKCARSYGTGGEVNSHPAPAFQINKRSRDCHRLGGDVFDSSTVSWSLLNPHDPAAGVSLKYSGGDTCEAFVGNTSSTETLRRSVKLDFLCDTSSGGIAQNVTVVESATCEYNMVIKGTQGCPVQCPVVKHGFGAAQLCNNHGVCDFNAKTGQAACFCNKGWSGADCTTNKDMGAAPVPNYSGAIVGTLIAGCLAGVILALLGYYGYQKYNGGGSAAASSAGGSGYAHLDEEAPAPTFSGSVGATSSGLDSEAGGYVAPSDGGLLD